MTLIKDSYKTSFGLLRANPKITGNIKITIDSSNDIWLNSIDSNDEMSKNQYKGYRIQSNSDYGKDCYNLFNSGRTDSSLIFGLKNENNQIDTYTQNLEDQYNGFYNTGATTLISSVYSEEFSYFSPFWMSENIPGYFVIYRIDDPIDFSYQIPVTTLEIGKTYKVIDNYDVDTSLSTYQAFSIFTGNNTYSVGTSFVANSVNFTIKSGNGNVILLDPNYNIPLFNNLSDNLINNILPKSKIVKSFSLGPESYIGKYLRKIKNDSNYAQNLIDVKFDSNLISTYNGVSIKDGIFAKKGEYLNPIFSSDSNIIDFEDYITKGFERNGIASYNLLNLEFLFNDADADMYSINRYFGIYVDNIASGGFQLSNTGFYSNSSIYGNFPQPTTPVQISNKMITPFYQTNDNGIRLFIDPSTVYGYIPTSDDININERLKLFYVKDKNDNFYSYNQTINYDLLKSTDPYIWGDNTRNPDSIVISNKTVDLSLFSGADPNQKKEYPGILTGTAGKSYTSISLLEQLSPGNTIVVYHPFGTYQQNNRRYDYFVASNLEYMIGGWGPGSWINDSGAYYFHPFGTTEQIAEAITGAINSIKYKYFKAFTINNEIVIRTNGADANNDSLYGILVYKDFYNQIIFNTPNSIFVNNIDSVYLHEPLDFIGGSKYTNTRIKIKIEDSNKIVTGKSCILTNNGFSIVKFVGKCIDQTDYELEYNSIQDYSTHAIVEISDNNFNIMLGSIGTFIVEELVSVETGVFSICGLKDFDFDFWSSDYGKILTDEYYRYIDIQPSGPIYPGIDYAVASDATIMYNDVLYGYGTNNFIFRGEYKITSPVVSPEIPVTTYTIIKGSLTSVNVIPTLYVKSIPDVIGAVEKNNAPQTDLDKFPGFAGLQDIKFLNDTNTILSKNDELNFGKVTNEYEVLKENYQRKLAINSRVNPYITKWIYEGGIDVRGNGYRLNSSNIFTPLNFSPSFFGAGRDPLYFSNEWYLLENIPMSATPNLLKQSSNYCVSGLDIDKLLNADPSSPDYFLNYFTIEGNDYYDIDNVKYTELKAKDVESRYTYFNYNEATGFSETLFRGIKARIKERTKAGIVSLNKNAFKNNDTEFDDYKFSCILKAIDDPSPYNVTSPITFNVYRNDTFKTVTLVITIIVVDSRFSDLSSLLKTFINSDNINHSSLNLQPIQVNKQTTSWFFNQTSSMYGTSGASSSVNVDYFGLYSIDDKLEISTYGTAGTSGVSNYESGGFLSSSIGSVKLSCSLNLKGTPSMGITPSVNSTSGKGEGILPIYANPTYDTDLREDVKFYSPNTDTNTFSGNPYNGSSIYTYQLFSPMIGGGYEYLTPFPTGTGKNFINFNAINSPAYVFNFAGMGKLLSENSIPIGANDITNYGVYQYKAGANYWNYILSRITFYEIYNLFLNQDSYINYTATSWNGTSQETSTGTYILEFLKPSSFYQNSRKLPIDDDYKPEMLASTVSGYKLTDQSTSIELFRYNGGYSPKFKNVLTFDNIKTDRFKNDHDANNDYLTYNVYFSPKIKGDSEYYGIGSVYEIYINGIPRKTLRIVKGSKYKFIFSNSPVIVTSPELGIENLVISTVIGSGVSSNLYTKGVTYDLLANSMIFEVPNNAPDELYYEFANEIFAGGNMFVTEGLEFKNTTLGIGKDSFGTIINLNYYKYALSNPFIIDQSSGYKPEYPLIGQTPIDKRDISIFESTWDAGRYRQYTSADLYTYLPGTKNMLEQKSFFGSKIMKTPNSFREVCQTKFPTSITDVFNVNINLYPNYEILWEETATQIKALLLLDRTTIKHFTEGRIGLDFNKYLVSEFGSGDGTSIQDDINQYVSLNVLPAYETKQLNVFIKTVYSNNSTSNNTETIITNLTDFEKMSSGYVKSTNNNITKIEGLEYQFVINKDPSLLYSVGFSYIIGKI